LGIKHRERTKEDGGKREKKRKEREGGGISLGYHDHPRLPLEGKRKKKEFADSPSQRKVNHMPHISPTGSPIQEEGKGESRGGRGKGKGGKRKGEGGRGSLPRVVISN